VDVTVALCTFNRAPLLARTLEAMRALEIPDGLAWELVVVDNGSTDRTPKLLESATGLPLRALHEPRPGKPAAANRATGAARGNLIVWTDDDTEPEPGWLRAYLDLPADGACFGGPVRGCFESAPPDWLAAGLDEVQLAYALIDLGGQRRLLRPGENLNGPNMAIRTEVARRYAWDEARGIQAGREGGLVGDESELLDRIRADGHPGYWLPDAVVHHFIPTASMSLEYVRHRYRLHGKALMAQRKSLAGGLRSLLSAGLEAYPRYLLGRLLRVPPRRWLRAFRRAQTHWGRLQGLFADTNRPL